MLRLAFSNLAREPARLAVTVAGVAASLVLVLALAGLFEGTAERIVDYPRRAGADVWVMQDGISNMHMASSFLPGTLAAAIASVPGVRSVSPILYVNGLVVSGERRWFSYVIGVSEDAAVGGPWEVTNGSAFPEPGGVVIPDVFLRQAGLGLGDSVTILNAEFRITGVSAGTYSLANSLAFVQRRDLARLLSAGEAVSYLMIEATPGTDPRELAGRLRDAGLGVNAMTTSEFVASDRVMARQMGVDVIQVMILIGFVIGVVVIGLTMYSATLQHSREYGVAKAIGASNTRLGALVATQASIIVGSGFALAVGLAFLIQFMLPLVAPDLALAYRPALFARVAAAALAMTVVACFVPYWRIARLEPMVVFKE